MVDETCIWLLDLDLFTEGDPAIDLGNFLAHLDELGLRRHGEIDALSRHGEAFLEGYGAVHALPDSGRIALLRSVSLARHINISRHSKTGGTHPVADQDRARGACSVR